MRCGATALLGVWSGIATLTLRFWRYPISGNDRKRLYLHRREFHRHLGQQASQPKVNSSASASAVASLPARHDAIALFTREALLLCRCLVCCLLHASPLAWRPSTLLPPLHASIRTAPHLTRDHMLIYNGTPRCRRLSSL